MQFAPVGLLVARCFICVDSSLKPPDQRRARSRRIYPPSA